MHVTNTGKRCCFIFHPEESQGSPVVFWTISRLAWRVSGRVPLYLGCICNTFGLFSILLKSYGQTLRHLGMHYALDHKLWIEDPDTVIFKKENSISENSHCLQSAQLRLVDIQVTFTATEKHIPGVTFQCHYSSVFPLSSSSYSGSSRQFQDSQVQTDMKCCKKSIGQIDWISIMPKIQDIIIM